MAAIPVPVEPRRRRRPRLRVLQLATAVLAILVLVGCTAASQSTLPSLAAPSVGPTASPTATPPAYPMTLTDDEGTAVTISSKPSKIVSLTPASTEILFAIGAGPRVAATTDFDDYPPEALSLPHVASYTSVDVEKIVGLGTDLVIAGGNNFNPPDSIAKLRSLHIPVLVTYAANVAGVLKDIQLVGQATGDADAANALATTMGAQFDAVRAVTSTLPHPKVFYELDATSTIYTATDASFLQEMIQIAGGDPVTTGSTTNSAISLEKLVTANPDLILLGDAAYGVTAAQVKARPGWGTIKAVISGSIVGVDDIVISRPGPRLVLGLLDLLRAIHPDLTLPSGLPSLQPAASLAPSATP
jgi:iron complex transport system substrate-binding protein